MSSSCNHDHDNSSHMTGVQRLTITFWLVAIYFVAELMGGFWTGSLALLADAGHMFSDMAALVISLFAAWISTRQSSMQQTFGYHRAEILAATVNAGSLFLVSGLILHEAWDRLATPSEILSGPMLWIALGGLAINLLSLKVLHGGHEHNLNVRGAWLHVMGDTLGSLGVILAAILVQQFGWTWADPVASILVCLLILFSAWRLMKESVGILMENAPRDIDVAQVEKFLTNVSGVRSLHCLHVWLIASGLKSLSAHLVLDPEHSSQFQLHQVRKQLQERFGIEHVTLQVELPDDPVCAETNVGSCLTVSL